MINKERLARRVHGRNQARAILDVVDLPHSDCVDGFLDELKSTLNPPEPVDEKKIAIERERAFSEFANYRLAFGQHNGERLERIPREYLEWLRDSTEETLKMVSGYLDATEQE